MSDMVFRFPAPGPEPMLTDLEGWTKIEGTPTMKTWVQHTSIDGSVISGTWEATLGTWHAAYKFYEFVHMIEGQITITPDGAAPVTEGLLPLVSWRYKPSPWRRVWPCSDGGNPLCRWSSR